MLAHLKTKNERGAKIFSALHVNVHVRLTLSICCEAIFTMLDIYVLGNLIVKLGFAKNPYLVLPLTFCRTSSLALGLHIICAQLPNYHNQRETTPENYS